MTAAEAVSAGVDPVHYLGDALADQFVEHIVEDVQVPKAEARRVGWAEGGDVPDAGAVGRSVARHGDSAQDLMYFPQTLSRILN